MTGVAAVGPAPMVKVGAEAPLRRKINKTKKEKKMKTFKEYTNEEVNEALKKFKSSLELGSGKKGSYFLEKVGHDSNGNWSYMVAKGSSKAKKVQHQGDWKGSKITSDATQDNLDASTAKEIIEYYEEFLK